LEKRTLIGDDPDGESLDIDDLRGSWEEFVVRLRTDVTVPMTNPQSHTHTQPCVLLTDTHMRLWAEMLRCP
jgi:hypothetical protein